MTAVAALLISQRPLQAEPRGGAVVEGAAGISQAGSVTNINQSTGKAIINWQGFSVGANEAVNFHQPGASSVMLNRVIGNEASVINGAISANGQVFIVNSAGVLFGRGSQVNVGGLVASTRDISNQDFMAGNYTFSGTSNASIVNQGRIRAHGGGMGGGYVALLGKAVSNEGVISARLGTVAMSAGEKMTLNFDGNSLLDVTIDKGALNALVANKRAIRADGGRVIMTARAADQVLSAQVNNTGIVQARTVAALKGGSGATARKGNIKIYAYGGTANIGGKLDASARKGGDGGFIETSGDRVQIAEGTKVTTLAPSGKTGTWLVDPTDFNIVAGSGAQTASGIGADTLVGNLATTNFTVTTAAGGTQNGDINVNAKVEWNANTTLTLNAAHDININAPVIANGASAGLVLNYGGYNGTTVTTAAAGTNYNIRTKASYAGTVLDADGLPVAKQDTSGGVYGSVSFTNNANANGLTINGQIYQLIHSISDFDALDGLNSVTGAGTASTVTGNYALAQNLDAGGTTYTRALINVFQGTLTGLGHTVDNLTINAPTTPLIGLIGQTATGGGTIRDIGLVNANVTGRGMVGSLLGRGADFTTIANVYATGSVRATGTATLGGNPLSGNGQYAGGLIGQLVGGRVTFAYADVNLLTAFNNSGGLIGLAQNGVVISNVHATGNLTLHPTLGGTGDGGLVGGGSDMTISSAYARGSVFGIGNNHGGLVGSIVGGRISGSFASGNVSGGSASAYLGGLLGYQSSGTTALENVYATGDVSGYTYIGGLIGGNNGTMIVNNAHAEGNATGNSDVGGFIGNAGAGATITNSHAIGDVVVTTAGSGGGFAGVNAGTIDQAYATGAVTDTYADPVTSSSVGGFVGLNTAVGTIKNAYSIGAVTGTRVVGGFAGSNDGHITYSGTGGNSTGTRTWITQSVFGTNDTIILDPGGIGGFAGKTGSTSLIENSYANNKVTGEGAVGAMVGSGSVGSRVVNSYWNIEKNPGLAAVGRTRWIDGSLNDPRVEVIGGGGLRTSQFADIAHYLDGTIDKVLADREAAEIEARRAAARAAEAAARAAAAAAAAAAQRAAFQAGAVRTGSTIAAGPDVSSSAPPATAAEVSATRQAAKLEQIDAGLKEAERNVKDEDKRRENERKAAARARAANANRGSGSGAGYRATIRSIDVDGQRFYLERDDNNGAKNNSAPPPGGRAQ